MVGKLQEGIYQLQEFDPESFLFLRALPGLSVRQVGEAFGTLWQIYQGLKNGKVRDLPEHPVPAGELTVLVDMVPKSLVSVISNALNQVM